MRAGTFRADVTPAAGEPLIWTTPAAKVEDPLWAKGVILDDGVSRSVLCAVDWCGLAGSSLDLFRRRIAAAAGADPARVAVHTVHQHTAPYVDGDAYALLGRLRKPPLRMSDRFLDGVTARVAAAAASAARTLRPFDRIGTGTAVVDRVGSARRLHGPDRRIVVRYSTSGKDPAMAAAPEGDIDPIIRTVTLAAGDAPMVRMHWYASHPQTFCCDGRVSADFAGAARETFERAEDVFQIYFTGCAGDVTVGKYNDGSPRAREELAARLLAGMKSASAATQYEAAGRIAWRSAPLRLPVRSDPAWLAAHRARLEHPQGVSGDDLYRSAIAVAFAARTRPLEAACLRLGNMRMLSLPGEPMHAFQKYAQDLGPRGFVAVAGYGDISPGYLCTDKAFEEGGYEPGASNAGPGSERALKDVIARLLRE